MYIDGVILFGLLVVALMLYMMFYIGRYAKRHMEIDEEKAHSDMYQYPIAEKDQTSG